MTGFRLFVARQHCLPDCLVIGPQRAGTTWLHEYFAARPDVAVPRGVKETFFFDRRYRRGVGWYGRHFLAQGQSRTVEVAPTYFHHPEVPDRIFHELGAVPLVCTLRDPARRAFSLYQNLRGAGLAQCTFRRAVERHPEILASSRYATCLRRWFQRFGRDGVCIVFLEDLACDQEAFVRRVCRHFGLEYLPAPNSLQRRVNENTLPKSAALARVGHYTAEFFRGLGWYRVVEGAKSMGMKPLFFGRPGTSDLPRLIPADREWFLELVQDEIEDLAELVGEPLPDWGVSSFPPSRAA
jgi:hypothetical protein